MIIDAHHHLWRYNSRDYTWMTGNKQILRADYLLPHLEATLRGLHVEGTVAVHARQTLEETDWLLQLSAQSSTILGVVGWVPLRAPDLEEYLERYCRVPKFKGVRHVLQDEPDDDYVLSCEFNRGIAMLSAHKLTYDILIYQRHLPQTIRFVDRHPNQAFVLNHIGKPRTGGEGFQQWEKYIRQLASQQNVSCKVSGLVTEADWRRWTAEQFRPYFDVVLSAFGPERLMFGSDWPVLTLASTYGRWLGVVRSFIETLSASEQESICSSTARRVYNL